MSDGNIRHRPVAKNAPPVEPINVARIRQQTNKLPTLCWSRIIAIIGVFAIFVLLLNKALNTKSNHIQERDAISPSSSPPAPPPTDAKTNEIITEFRDKCSFRSYPSKRLYGLSSKSQPKFLSEAAYIRGQWPIILNPIEDGDKSTHGEGNFRQANPVWKVCIDTTSWEDLKGNGGGERLPFTDGHNPSVVSLAPNPYRPDDSRDLHMRLNPKHLKPVSSALPSVPLKDLFLAISTFGGGQCKFGFSPEEVDEYRFSLYENPPGGKRAVVAVLYPPNLESVSELGSTDHQSSFRTLAQTTLLLERDAKYGTSRRNAIGPERSSSGFDRIHQEFDDARLFFHLGRVWVLYRNGPLFGYTSQVHNPIHFEDASSEARASSGVAFVAYVKASETLVVDGGRNIALISEEPLGGNENGEVGWVSSPSLKALTWIDPVTIIDGINVQGQDALMNTRRLQEESDHVNESRGERIDSTVEGSTSEYLPMAQHRRLGSKPNKSNIHGTNGYMVPLTSTGELLGVAHFHRPENREKSDFALHGHHYTHAFFTIAREADGNVNDMTSRPFKLRRLSNEFVFRANSILVGETRPTLDADIIQFASGLDLVGSDVDGQLIISYGINDCEGAIFSLPMKRVQQILIVVGRGQEVADLMKTIKR